MVNSLDPGPVLPYSEGMTQDEIIEAENRLCEVYEILMKWHPEWQVILTALSSEGRTATIYVRVNGLKYRYATETKQVLLQKPAALAWFVEQVVRGALTR